MIKQYIPISLLAVSALFGSQALAQDEFSKDFESVRQELTSWDPVRGEWLSNSLVAMTQHQPVPDRMFPEDYTPMEMMKEVPGPVRERILTTAQTQSTNGLVNNRDSWNQVASMVNRTSCKSVTGRTYGDPHLSSFDDASYSFQTVGEFVLAKSSSGNFEVQTRQRAQNEDISLNTAVAMNVAGDRVCFYAQEKPDGNNTTPIRLNGEAIYLNNATYYLDHGGTIRQTNRNNYLIAWPSGENVSVDMQGQGGSFPFLNVTVLVFPCVDTYEGVLGNANGRSSDDFDTRGSSSRPADLAFRNFGSGPSDPASQEMERQYLAFMAKDFASSWRITQQTSLFDYGFGMNTLSYTDESFPRIHHTLYDLTPTQRDNARRDCERAGVLQQDMNGCIYDRGFVNIPPSPRPVINDRTHGRVLKPVTEPLPNVNPGHGHKAPISVEAASPDKTQGGRTPQTIGTDNQPATETNGAVTKKPDAERQITRPSETEKPATPVEKPVTTTEKPARTVEKPVTTIEQPKKPVEEEEKPVRNSGIWGNSSSSGSSSSGSSSSGLGGWGSSSAGSSSGTISRPSTPAPVHTPAPVSTPAPARTTPATMPSRGGR